MAHSLLFDVNNEPWNKGMIIGPKPPLKLKEVWAIRIRVQLSGDVRNLALFNVAVCNFESQASAASSGHYPSFLRGLAGRVAGCGLAGGGLAGRVFALTRSLRRSPSRTQYPGSSVV